MSKKKPHPADAAAEAGIRNAASFQVQWFQDRKPHRWDIPTLAEARAKAAEMAPDLPRGVGVYAITDDGKAYLVPPGFDPDADSDAVVAAAVAEANAETRAARKPRKRPAKAPKSARPRKAAKSAKRTPAAKNGPSKTDIAIKLLTRPGGAARKEVTEATEWPSINLKAIAKRRKLKLTEKDGVLRMHA